ncbi:MAG: ABC-type multidrug transport system, ATPase component [Candidatus Binatus sp.]|nr:ABC-type multidrug transport system, ATPase component [Candidatus Binatus sp.]
MRISRAASTPRDNLGSIDANTYAAPFSRHQPIERKAVALRVVGLTKRYGKTIAVSDLDFEIREGEIFGLLGPNGAGKTSTIAMLATQRQPSAGDATLFGHSMRKEPYLVRQIVGLAPQEVSLYPALTAAENLQFFGSIYGVRQSELRKRIDDLLALVGLVAHRDDQVSIFSGGMKRRLNLAVSLVHRPKLILLDEPTAGVDPQSREQILKIIGRLRDEGNAILYTTHYMEEAERLCDRLGILSEGKLVAVGTLDALLSGLEFAEIIEVRGLSAGVDLEGMRALPGVSRIERGGGMVRLYVKRATDFLWPLQKIISRCDQNVRLKITPLSLENLFLHLTGMELRD